MNGVTLYCELGVIFYGVERVFFDKSMATHAATSIFIRIIAPLFLSESVMHEGQSVIRNSMQDCGSNFVAFNWDCGWQSADRQTLQGNKTSPIKERR